MPIHVRQNQYKGVNAHLHSIFQSGDSFVQWGSFHNVHVADMTRALNMILPPPYRAMSELSLQIRVIDAGGYSYHQTRKPDVTIVKPPTGQRSRPVPSLVGSARTWEFTLEETFPDNDILELRAVVIYQAIEERGHRYIPVTRIELLSPTNKPGSSQFTVYEEKRWEALQSGLPLVEIDYLHETSSPISRLPIYPDDANACPYNITISDPRMPPDMKAVHAYGFNVDTPIPTLDIPLAGEDGISLAFDAIYQDTFEGGRWGDDVDYEQEPPRIESYREDDQQRIRAVMQAVAQRTG